DKSGQDRRPPNGVLDEAPLHRVSSSRNCEVAAKHSKIRCAAHPTRTPRSPLANWKRQSASKFAGHTDVIYWLSRLAVCARRRSKGMGIALKDILGWARSRKLFVSLLIVLTLAIGILIGTV